MRCHSAFFVLVLVCVWVFAVFAWLAVYDANGLGNAAGTAGQSQCIMTADHAVSLWCTVLSVCVWGGRTSRPAVHCGVAAEHRNPAAF